MLLDGETRPITRVRAVVLVSRLDRPTRRALGCANAVRAHSIEAVTVQVDEAAANQLVSDWVQEEVEIPLTAVASPSGDLVQPVVDHVTQMLADGPRDLISVFVPQYVLGGWWEWLLHHRGARRLHAKLRQLDRVVLTTVPWQLPSALS